MIQSISNIPPPAPIEPVAPIQSPGGADALQPAGANSFAAVFADAVRRVEEYQNQADLAVNKFLSGQDEEVHKVAIAANQAETAFDLFLQVKNKVVNAYQEIMRMQL